MLTFFRRGLPCPWPQRRSYETRRTRTRPCWPCHWRRRSSSRKRPRQARPLPAVNAVDPASIQALKDMGAYLQTLKRFRASTSLTGERVLADGQKLLHTASATVDACSVRTSCAPACGVFAPSAKSSMTARRSPSTSPRRSTTRRSSSRSPTANSSSKLEERYGVEIPMSDLFRGAPRPRRSTRSNRR